MERSDTYAIPVSHPSLPGHFPGDPVVPGVVILECVKCSTVALSGSTAVEGFPQVKFVAPLRPGERFVVTVRGDGSARYRFECRRDDTLLCSGTLTMRVGEDK